MTKLEIRNRLEARAVTHTYAAPRLPRSAYRDRLRAYGHEILEFVAHTDDGWQTFALKDDGGRISIRRTPEGRWETQRG